MNRSLFVSKALPFLILSCLCSCGIRLPIPKNQATPTARPKVTDCAPTHPDDGCVDIWLVSDPLHSGMVFDYAWLKASGFVPSLDSKPGTYVSMSWGDETAYVNHGLHTPWELINALFLPSRSVMEIISFDGNVPEICSKQRIFHKRIPRDCGPQLARFLNGVSRSNSKGTPYSIARSSWGNGLLYPSRCSYFFPRVCNIWTLQALEATGTPVYPWFGIFANGTIRQAKNDGFQQIWPGIKDDSLVPQQDMTIHH